MQFLNKNVRGHVEVGHIDLLTTIAYFEVPEEDALRVIKYVNGQQYKGREVRCNDAEETAGRPAPKGKPSRVSRDSRTSRESRPSRPARAPKKEAKTYQKDEWMQFLNPNSMKTKGEKKKAKELKGEIPDFSEEGWAIRKPRKKK